MTRHYHRAIRYAHHRFPQWLWDVGGLTIALTLTLTIHQDLMSIDRGVNLAHDGTNFSAEHALIRNALRDFGSFPSWNYHYLSGMPFHASPQTAAFYFTAILDWLAPNELLGMRFGVVLSIVASSLGGYFMARTWGANQLGALLAAILMGGGGAQLGRLWAGHVSFLLAAPYYPFALSFVHIAICRRSFIAMLAAGSSLGLAILAGGGWVALNLWLLTSIVAIFLTLSRTQTLFSSPYTSLRTLALLGSLPTTGILMAAAKLLPMLAYLPYSSRDMVNYGFASDRSFLTTPSDLLNVLISQSTVVLDKAGNGANLWHEFTVYVGIIPLFAAIFAIITLRSRATWILGCVIVVFAAFAYGPSSPIDLYRLLFEIVPGYENVRIPGRMLSGVWISIVLLAALGVTVLTRRPILIPLGCLLIGLVFYDIQSVAHSWHQPAEIDEHRIYLSDDPGELVAGVTSLEISTNEASTSLFINLELGNYGNTIWLPGNDRQPGGIVATLGYLGSAISSEIPLPASVGIREKIRLTTTLPPPPVGGAMLMLGMKSHGIRSFDRPHPQPLNIALSWTTLDNDLTIRPVDPRSRLLPPILDSWFPFAADLETGPGRFLVSRYDIFNEADALRQNVEIVSGWDPGYLKHFTNFLGTSMLFTVPVDLESKNILAILNTRYIYPHLGPEHSFTADPEFILVPRLPFKVYELINSRPRVFLSPRAIVLFTPLSLDESALQLRRLITHPQFNPLHTTIIVIGPDESTGFSVADLSGLNPTAIAVIDPNILNSRQGKLLNRLTANKTAIDISSSAYGDDPEPWGTVLESMPPVEGKGTTIDLISQSPGRAVMVANNPSDNTRVLNFSTIWMPGWTALLDGLPVPTVLADGAVIGILVPSGRHQIHLEYNAPWLLPGIILTTSFGLFLLGAGIFTWQRHNSKSRESQGAR